MLRKKLKKEQNNKAVVVEMETRCICRRIDDLGRITIPKAILKKLSIREGNLIAISVDVEKNMIHLSLVKEDRSKRFSD